MCSETEMAKNIIRIGKNYGVEIDEAILEELGIGPDTLLDVRVEDGKLIVAPLRDEERKKKLEATLHEIDKKFGNALKKLADS